MAVALMTRPLRRPKARGLEFRQESRTHEKARRVSNIHNWIQGLERQSRQIQPRPYAETASFWSCAVTLMCLIVELRYWTFHISDPLFEALMIRF